MVLPLFLVQFRYLSENIQPVMPYRQPARKRRGRPPGGLYDVARLTPALLRVGGRAEGGGRWLPRSRSFRGRRLTYAAIRAREGHVAGLPGWSDERVLEVLSHDLVFVARRARSACRLCRFAPRGRRANRSRAAFRRAGPRAARIGHRLLAYAEGDPIAERARSLQIIVEEGNQTARRFYRRSGFVPVSRTVRTHPPDDRLKNCSRRATIVFCQVV